MAYESHFDQTKEKFKKYILYVFVLIVAVFLTSYIVFFRILLSTNASYMKNNVTQFKSGIENIEQLTNNLSSQIFFDEDVQLISREKLSEEEMNTVHNRLSFYKNSDVYIESVNVYDIQNNCMFSSEYFSKKQITPEVYEEVSDIKKTLSYKYDESQKRGLYSYKLKPYKYIPYIVEINYFLNKFDYSNNDEFIYMIYDLPNKVLINASDSEEVMGIIDSIIDKKESDAYFVRKIHNRKQFVFWKGTADNIYICYTSYSGVIRKMMIFFVSIFGLFLLFGMIIFFGLIKGLRDIKEFFGNLVVFERNFELVYKQKDEIDKLRFIENSDKFSEGVLEKNIKKYELNSESVYNMIMFKIDNERIFSETVPIREQDAIKFSIVNVFEEMMLKYSSVMTITNNNELIFIYSPEKGIDIDEVIRTVQKFIRENIDVSFSAFICTESVGIKDLCRAYRVLQKLREYRIYYGNGCILSDAQMQGERKIVNISGCWNELLVKFEEKRLDELENTYFSIVEKISDIPPKEFIMANKLLILELISIVKKTRIEISEDLSLFLESIDDMETKEDITKAFVFILKKAESFKAETLAVENREFVYQIVEYIEDNCADTLLCRESIAEKFNINVRKIDAAFKDVMFISITNYIREYRLKKAAEYLTETDLPVSNITKMVGFNTDSHFVYTFRKKFKMTPITYRKMNTERK